MTNEDKQLIADYMGWRHWPQGTGQCYRTSEYGSVIVNFDLNDASLVVAEMRKRGDYFVFEMYAIGLFKSIGYRKVTAKFIPWLMTMEDGQAKNFFAAFVEWRKGK